jgi:hypothetical protein
MSALAAGASGNNLWPRNRAGQTHDEPLTAHARFRCNGADSCKQELVSRRGQMTEMRRAVGASQQKKSCCNQCSSGVEVEGG